MSRLVLIDGHAILHRAYHAYPRLTTRKGELINAVYGFSSILLSVLKHLHPEYVACAFDVPKPTFRHKEFKGYKAHRPKVDEDLVKQIPKAKGVVRTLNIPIFEKEGFEADDVIGSLAKQANLKSKKHLPADATALQAGKAKSKDKDKKSKLSETLKLPASPCLAGRQTAGGFHSKTLEVIIVTGDKDVLQLIDKNIKVFIPARGKQPAQLYDRKAFLEKYGFEPKKLVDFKALSGDASDAIPGVRGVGPRTTRNLIIQFGDLKNIYQNLNKIGGKINTNLKQGRKQALLSYRLAKIVTNVPIQFDLSKCRLLDYDKKKVIQLFEELEFRSLIKRLPGEEKAGEKKSTLSKLNKTEGIEDKQMGLF